MAATRFVRFSFTGSPFEARESFYTDLPRDTSPSAPSASPPQEHLLPTARAAPPRAAARVRVDKLTPALFQERYVGTGTPVVITGLFEKDMSCWELANFWPLLDEEAPLQCRIHGGDRFALSPERWSGRSHARRVVTTSSRRYAETIASGVAQRDDLYVQSDIARTRAGKLLQPRLERLARATGLRLHQQYGPIVNMWWGGCGHTEPLHIDVTDGTLLQLCGQKHVVLYPPCCWKSLAPFPVDPGGMSWAFSRAAGQTDPPDLVRFPGLAEAWPLRQEVLLREGEVLFIPACCAHEIRGERSSLSSSGPQHVLSVNRFWRTSPYLVHPHLPEDALAAYEKCLAFYS